MKKQILLALAAMGLLVGATASFAGRVNASPCCDCCVTGVCECAQCTCCDCATCPSCNK